MISREHTACIFDTILYLPVRNYCQSNLIVRQSRNLKVAGLSLAGDYFSDLMSAGHYKWSWSSMESITVRGPGRSLNLDIFPSWHMPAEAALCLFAVF